MCYVQRCGLYSRVRHTRAGSIRQTRDFVCIIEIRSRLVPRSASAPQIHSNFTCVCVCVAVCASCSRVFALVEFSFIEAVFVSLIVVMVMIFTLTARFRKPYDQVAVDLCSAERLLVPRQATTRHAGIHNVVKRHCSFFSPVMPIHFMIAAVPIFSVTPSPFLLFMQQHVGELVVSSGGWCRLGCSFAAFRPYSICLESNGHLPASELNFFFAPCSL